VKPDPHSRTEPGRLSGLLIATYIDVLTGPRLPDKATMTTLQRAGNARGKSPVCAAVIFAYTPRSPALTSVQDWSKRVTGQFARINAIARGEHGSRSRTAGIFSKMHLRHSPVLRHQEMRR
jgi:hypothetical protein